MSKLSEKWYDLRWQRARRWVARRAWPDAIAEYGVAVYLPMHLATMAISWRVWLPQFRAFPVVSPIFEEVWPGVLVLLSALLIVLLLAAWASGGRVRRMALGGVLSCMILAGLCEQLTWQPYWYLAGLLYLNLIFHRSVKDAQAVLLILMVGMYVFSGLHKLNPMSADMFHGLFLGSLPPESGYLAGGVECLLGGLLLFDRSRQLACSLLIMMHTMILLWLGPLELYGHWYNFVVWPWNIAQILVLLRLGQASLTPALLASRRAIDVGLLTFAAQSLCFVGYWPNYFSYNLYSYTTPCIVLELPPDQGSGLPHTIRLDGKRVLNFDQWAMQELEVTTYPEQAYLEKLCHKIHQTHGGHCRYFPYIYDYYQFVAKAKR